MNRLGQVGMRIVEKLKTKFNPTHLDVICESHLHNVPKGSEKHFHVQIVSELFEGCSVLQRHRLVNDCLEDELKTSVHALRIDAIPPSKWVGQKSAPPPACRGGGQL